MTISVALVATLFNTFAARRLPMFEGMILYLHIFLWFAVGGPLCSPRQVLVLTWIVSHSSLGTRA
jgi:hypothetical protein